MELHHIAHALNLWKLYIAATDSVYHFINKQFNAFVESKSGFKKGLKLVFDCMILALKCIMFLILKWLGSAVTSVYSGCAKFFISPTQWQKEKRGVGH